MPAAVEITSTKIVATIENEQLSHPPLVGRVNMGDASISDSYVTAPDTLLMAALHNHSCGSFCRRGGLTQGAGEYVSESESETITKWFGATVWLVGC